MTAPKIVKVYDEIDQFQSQCDVAECGFEPDELQFARKCLTQTGEYWSGGGAAPQFHLIARKRWLEGLTDH